VICYWPLVLMGQMSPEYWGQFWVSFGLFATNSARLARQGMLLDLNHNHHRQCNAIALPCYYCNHKPHTWGTASIKHYTGNK